MSGALKCGAEETVGVLVVSALPKRAVGMRRDLDAAYLSIVVGGSHDSLVRSRAAQLLQYSMPDKASQRTGNSALSWQQQWKTARRQITIPVGICQRESPSPVGASADAQPRYQRSSRGRVVLWALENGGNTGLVSFGPPGSSPRP